MAHHKSAKTRIERNNRRRTMNTARVSRIRTFLKRVELAIGQGDKAVAQAALSAAEPEVMRGVSKGILHKNTASRKISRLNKRVAALQ